MADSEDTVETLPLIANAPFIVPLIEEVELIYPTSLEFILAVTLIEEVVLIVPVNADCIFMVADILDVADIELTKDEATLIVADTEESLWKSPSIAKLPRISELIEELVEIEPTSFALFIEVTLNDEDVFIVLVRADAILIVADILEDPEIELTRADATLIVQVIVEVPLKLEDIEYEPFIVADIDDEEENEPASFLASDMSILIEEVVDIEPVNDEDIDEVISIKSGVSVVNVAPFIVPLLALEV
jgi:hypothetical protein